VLGIEGIEVQAPGRLQLLQAVAGTSSSFYSGQSSSINPIDLLATYY
jgi:hypothetical protein